MQSEKSLSNISVIVLTGQSLTSDEMKRLNRGVAAVLSKGVYSVAETAAFIAETLARSPRLGNDRQRLARRAMAYVHEHYAESITRDELAASLGVSGDHLTRFFHEETGLTLTGYLRRVRIRRAKELLAEGEKSVTEVALAVGFSDSNYFARLFRQETGQSPRDYQRS